MPCTPYHRSGYFKVSCDVRVTVAVSMLLLLLLHSLEHRRRTVGRGANGVYVCLSVPALLIGTYFTRCALQNTGPSLRMFAIIFPVTG